MLRRLLLPFLAVVVAAGCIDSGPAATTRPADPTTTSTVPPSSTTTTSPGVDPDDLDATVSPSLDPEVVARMREELAELVGVTESVRGLPFLTAPKVAILDEAAFTDRVNALIREELDPEEVAADARFFAMLGMLDPGTDLARLLVDLYTEQVAGFYDGDTEELVVPASEDGFTVLQRITVVHELVHALTDQHFDFDPEFQRRNEEGNGDDAAAMAALVEGDATYFQLVYMESLSPLEALQAATEALSIDTSVLEAAPDWIAADLTFPYDQGLRLVETLVDDGGIARVDRAYQELPDTTEQVLEPAKYLRREAPLPLEPLDVELAGWELFDEGTLGEWGLRLVLGTSNPPGFATQAAAGWGNDTYREFVRGDDTAMVLRYRGDSVSDAEDLTDALLTHVSEKIDTGEPVEVDGGLRFRGATYVFLDRVDDEVLLVVSTDEAAGEELRRRVGG